MKFIKYIILIPFIVNAQSINKNLIKAKSLFFRDNIYVYGFNKTKNELIFKFFKFNKQLNLSDSNFVSLGDDDAEDFLDISADTIHGYLNFYLQKSDSKNLATLIRSNDSLRLICKAENFEAGKINSLTAFENEIYTFKNATYTIRASEDSTGKQFFLSKYEITSDKKPFEYKPVWQYPLEKKNINATHIFYANEDVLFIYVNILSGEKQGQWVLKLNAKTGKLIKGLRLNEKSDNRTFVYNAFYYDQKNKHMLVTGNIYSDDQLDIEENNFTFKNQDKKNTFFFMGIDSLCENITRNEKTVPFVFAINKPVTKEIAQYHVKIKEIKKTGENEYRAYAALYKNLNKDLLFIYETGFFMNFTVNEMDVEFYSDKIYFNCSSLKCFVNFDTKDINGKIELKSILEFDKFLYKKPISDVELLFGKDDLKNPKWVLTKTDINSSIKSFYEVKIGPKGTVHKLILENSKYQYPQVYKAEDDKIILFNTNTESSNFSLSVKIW